MTVFIGAHAPRCSVTSERTCDRTYPAPVRSRSSLERRAAEFLRQSENTEHRQTDYRWLWEDISYPHCHEPRRMSHGYPDSLDYSSVPPRARLAGSRQLTLRKFFAWQTCPPSVHPHSRMCEISACERGAVKALLICRLNGSPVVVNDRHRGGPPMPRGLSDSDERPCQYTGIGYGKTAY